MPLSTIDILQKLIGFATISRTDNRGMIQWVAEYLAGFGIESTIIEGRDDDVHSHGANLWAKVGNGPGNGPGNGNGGFVLSGHSDVVPVVGQDWENDPFTMTIKDGRAYGRGTADMKGFIASAIRAMVLAKGNEDNMQKPLYLALSYDEEIGCIGVKHLLHHLKTKQIQPDLCIIGEPTQMKVGIGHKGKLAFKITAHGLTAHSALAPQAVNANYMIGDFMQILRDYQDYIARHHPREGEYDIAYSTLHTGIIAGGVQLNIVPHIATAIAEIRNIASDNAQDIYEQIQQKCHKQAEYWQKNHAGAGYRFEITNSYPGLITDKNNQWVQFCQNLGGENQLVKCSFGTEAGLFTQELQTSAVILGPGSMEQGHKPNEFIALSQLTKCDEFLQKLINHCQK